MNRPILASLVLLAASLSLLGGCKKDTPQIEPSQQSAVSPEPAPQAETETGEALFKKHCSVCHPDGGNIVNPELILQSKALKANNITSAADIVKIMRNPKPGMSTFDETVLPENDANAIADYILKTF
jgi:cytochrome c6